jgi:spermidine synthase
VAILGNAAGTTARALGHYFPATLIDGVEIDGEITEAGRELFDLRAPRLRTHTADARPWLRRADDRYDAILIDAYRQPYIPFYLATKEFFQLVRDRLAPGGLVIINVGHPEHSDDLEEVLAATMRSVFGSERVWRDPSEDTNTMLVGTRAGRAPADALRSRLVSLPDEVRPVAAATAVRLEPARRGGRVYTDDVAPVEWLVDASIVDVAADGER